MKKYCKLLSVIATIYAFMCSSKAVACYTTHGCYTYLCDGVHKWIDGHGGGSYACGPGQNADNYPDSGHVDCSVVPDFATNCSTPVSSILPTNGPVDTPIGADLGPAPNQCGSIINVPTTTLGEILPVDGTPYVLTYSSDRAAGRLEYFQFNVNSVLQPGGNFDATSVVAEVAGKRRAFDFSAGNSSSTVFTWDGLDAFGRRPLSVTPMTLHVTYGASAQALSLPWQDAATNSNALVLAANGRAQSTNRISSQVSKDLTSYIGVLDARLFGLGGWNLNILHALDPNSKTVYLGGGSKHSAANLVDTLNVLAADPAQYSGANIPKNFPVTYTGGGRLFAQGSDGSLHFWESAGADYLVKVDSSSRRTVIAGSGSSGFAADDIAAGSSTLSLSACAFDQSVRQVYETGSGAIYFAECSGSGATDIVRLRRIDQSTGIVTTVAGVSDYGGSSQLSPRSGDGDLATAAVLHRSDFRGFAVGSDGWMYVLVAATRGSVVTNLIRRISPDGIIATIVAGPSGSYSFLYTDVGLAVPAVPNPVALDVGPDGSLFVAFADCQIVQFLKEGHVKKQLAGMCSDLPTSSYLGDLRVDQSGLVYRLDFGGAQIVTYNPLISNSSPLPFAGHNAPSADFFNSTFSVPGYTNVTQQSLAQGAPALTSQISAKDLVVPASGGILFDNADSLGQRVIQVGKNPAYVSTDGQELYVFDANGRHLKTVSTVTAATLFSFSYNASGLLSSITDVNGLVTSVQRNASGFATALVAPHGQTTLLGLDADGYLETLQDSLGHAAKMTYHVNSLGVHDGLLTGYTDLAGNVRTYTFDNLGRLTTALDPLASLKTLSKSPGSPPGTDQTIFTSPLGRQTAYGTTQSKGQLTTSTTYPDASRIQTVFSAANQVATASFPDGSSQQQLLAPDIRYGMSAPFAQQATYASGPGNSLSTTMTRSVQIGDVSDPATLRSITESLIYDSRVPPYKTVTDAVGRTQTATTPLGRTSIIGFDSKGREISRTVPGSAYVATAYDSEGRPATITAGQSGCRPDGLTCRRTVLSYDQGGYLSHVVLPDGSTLDLENDSKGHVLSETVNRLKPDQEQYTFSYDANSNLTSVKDNATHTLQYSPLDLLTTYQPPAVDAAGSGRQAYAYSKDRELLNATFQGPVGTTQIQRSYDPSSGQLLSLVYPGGEVDYKYNSAGQISEVAGPGSSDLHLNYTGPYLTSTYQAGFSQQVSITLDVLQRPSYISANGEQIGPFIYDGDGALISVFDNTLQSTLALTRDPQTGYLSNLAFGVTSQSRSYDLFGATSEAKDTALGVVAADVTYTYDGLGRIASRSESLLGIDHNDANNHPVWALQPASTASYTYSGGGRLTSVTQGSTTLLFTYDANGNRIERGQTYDAQDRLITDGSVAYTYDNQGALSQKTDSATQITSSYQYDALGRLLNFNDSSSASVSYSVDGLGRRLTRTGPDGTWSYLYDGQNRLIYRSNRDLRITEHYGYASRGNIPDYMTRGNAGYRIMSDERGSVRLVINATDGTVAQRMDYDVWGSVTADTNPGFQPFGFAGGLYDSVTGLVRFGARDYDASTGRWVSKDPLLFGGGQSNLYAYVGNDPVNRIDPSGLTDAQVQATISYIQARTPGTPSVKVIYVPGGTALAIPGVNVILLPSEYQDTDISSWNAQMALLRHLTHEIGHINAGLDNFLPGTHQGIIDNANKIADQNQNDFPNYLNGTCGSGK